MRRLAFVLCVIGGLWLSLGLRAQRNGTTQLLLHVEPDADLSHPRVALRFRLEPNSTLDLSRQTEVITARARALPDQRIRLLARVAALAGPPGDLPPSALRWAGTSITAASQSGLGACGSGSFQDGALHDLVTGWTRSGTVTCEITFSLAEPARLPPGVYSGAVDLTLRAE